MVHSDVYKRQMEKAIDYNVDYFAFCDQDDVWDEDKLKIGVEKLELNQDGKPALYYCCLLYTSIGRGQ